MQAHAWTHALATLRSCSFRIIFHRVIDANIESGVVLPQYHTTPVLLAWVVHRNEYHFALIQLCCPIRFRILGDVRIDRVLLRFLNDWNETCAFLSARFIAYLYSSRFFSFRLRPHFCFHCSWYSLGIYIRYFLGPFFLLTRLSSSSDVGVFSWRFKLAFLVGVLSLRFRWFGFFFGSFLGLDFLLFLLRGCSTFLILCFRCPAVCFSCFCATSLLRAPSSAAIVLDFHRFSPGGCARRSDRFRYPGVIIKK